MDLEDSFCRLCAESKPSNKQLDLQTDDSRRCEIIHKLVRLNAATDFNVETLPKTVCLECVQALNKAFDFVVAIEYAQNTLSLILAAPKLKQEKVNFEGDDEENTVIVCVKKESDELEIDSESNEIEKKSDDLEIREESNGIDEESDGEQNISSSQENSKITKNLDIDSIPLSQLSKLKLSWKNYSWYCTFCETIFPTIDELQTHSIEVHKMCNPYRCTDCNIRKVRLERFLQHIQTHHKYLRYSCYKCFEQFKSVIAARKHRITHKTTEFICSGCNKAFVNDDKLKKHMDDFCQLHKGRNIPKSLQPDGLTCKVCQKTFKTKSVLNSHVITHMERKKTVICEICGRGFYHKHNLMAHMTMHTKERPFKCQICDYAFKTERLLVSHVGVHNKEKPFACSECGKRFRLHRQLNSHSIIHTDIHPHSCPHCPKRFRFRSILNNHVRLHTGERPYACEQCQRDFSNWSNYNKHMKRKHNMDTSRKKHTPEGSYPIDPKTGQVIVHKETNKMTEWKNKMLVQRSLGRPRKRPPENVSCDISTTVVNKSTI